MHVKPVGFGLFQNAFPFFNNCLNFSLTRVHSRVVDPVSIENEPIFAEKLSKTMSEIVLKISLVMQTVFIILLTPSTLLVVMKLTPVYPTVCVPESAFTVPFAVEELSMVVISIGPVIVSLAVGHILPKGTCVCFSIIKSDCP